MELQEQVALSAGEVNVAVAETQARADEVESELESIRRQAQATSEQVRLGATSDVAQLQMQIEGLEDLVAGL